MALLIDCDFERTTLLQLIQQAEKAADDAFDMVHLSLDSGRDLILVAISGESLDAMATVMEGLREMREEA